MSLFVCFYCLIGLVGGFTRIVAEGQGLSDCFFTRRNSFHAENHGWSRMSVMNFLFYHELSNFRIVSSHGVSRKVTDFFCPELSNCRINTFNHTENRGGHELSNCFFTRKIMCISWVSQTSIRR